MCSIYNYLAFVFGFFFFFKQKTAYEMRISDWSSDVCSSDLMKNTCALPSSVARPGPTSRMLRCHSHRSAANGHDPVTISGDAAATVFRQVDRKSVVEGKSVSVRVDLGGRRIIKKKKIKKYRRRENIARTKIQG